MKLSVPQLSYSNPLKLSTSCAKDSTFSELKNSFFIENSYCLSTIYRNNIISRSKYRSNIQSISTKKSRYLFLNLIITTCKNIKKCSSTLLDRQQIELHFIMSYLSIYLEVIGTFVDNVWNVLRYVAT